MEPKMRQRFLLIPSDGEYEKSQWEYQENQKQLQEVFKEFAASVGLEAEHAKFYPMYLFVIPTRADRVRFCDTFTDSRRHWGKYSVVNIDSMLFRCYVEFLHKKGIQIKSCMGFRHFCTYSGADAYFQEFTLDGKHYGSILAPEGFTVTDMVQEIGAEEYQLALLRYVQQQRTVPGFRN